MQILKRFSLTVAALSILAAPAAAQTRRFTNADLGKPIAHPHVLTAEEWQSIVDHQYVAVATPTPDLGPRVVVLLDSTPHVLPPTFPLAAESFYAPFSAPYYASTYVGRRGAPSHEWFSHDFSDRTRKGENLRAVSPVRPAAPRVGTTAHGVGVSRK